MSAVVAIALSALIVVGLCVWGALVFGGSERAFRLLNGGCDFLALDPDDRTFRREARQSAVALWSGALLLACFVTAQFVGRTGIAEALVETVRTLCFAVGAVSAAVVVIVIVLQVRTYARLLKRRP